MSSNLPLVLGASVIGFGLFSLRNHFHDGTDFTNGLAAARAELAGITDAMTRPLNRGGIHPKICKSKKDALTAINEHQYCEKKCKDYEYDFAGHTRDYTGTDTTALKAEPFEPEGRNLIKVTCRCHAQHMYTVNTRTFYDLIPAQVEGWRCIYEYL